VKSTALSELLPQWTKFVVTDLSGRDPLGLARVATNITDHLMPGIVVATDRARYYALYSWILWNIQETESPTSDAMFAEAFQRREAAFAIATLLEDADSSPVGKRAVVKELERAETDVRMAFKVLPSNDLGGYGQYYSGSLYLLGLTHQPQGEFPQITEGRGVRLAQAIEKTIRATQWVTERSFLKRRNSLQSLKASAARLSLDAVHRPFAEHERVVLTDMFLGLDVEESGSASLRRQSLARLIDLVRAHKRSSIPLKPTKSVTLDDQLVLGPAYFGTLVDGNGHAAMAYVPPPFLASCSSMWRQFCLHEILSWSLESVLGAVLSTLGDGSSAGLPIDEIVDRLSGKELIQAVEAFAKVKARTPKALLDSVGVHEKPDATRCHEARLRFSFKARLNEDVLMRSEASKPVEVLGRSVICLALLYAKWRDASDDSSWLRVRATAGPELASTTVLPHLDSWLSNDQGWTKPVRSLLELVINQHDRVMYEKGRLEACWLHREDNRLVHDQDYQPGYPPHNSRQKAAMGILVDLGLALQGNDGQLTSTKEGERAYLRAQELAQ
jgi:hypothetical protein